MKTFSLFKAVLSQDMNMFAYTVKNNSSKYKKILFPILLFLLVCISIGSYAFMISEKLYTFKLTYVVLSMFIAIVSIFTFIQGIYKSQGILFEARDNDLLFSLPIKKSNILFIRIFKLLLFEYIYNLMFLLPAFVAYIYYEKPSIDFYFISLLMTFLIPIIPTVISSFLGYIVKTLSSKASYKKIVQTILSIVVLLLIFFISSKLDSFIDNIVLKATDINDVLIKIYYPIGAYISLINKFDLVVLIKLVLINVLPLLLFIFIGSKYYFKIISDSKGNIVKNKKIKRTSFKSNKPIKSLIIKELKRYISSPVYILNTSFGLFLSLIVSLLLCIKGRGVFENLLSGYGLNNSAPIQLLYYGLIFFSTSMTSITSSSISLEGRTMNITKSLPIEYKDILNSKVIYPFVIELPFILIGELIYFIVFKPSIFYVVVILLIGVITIFFSAVLGLLVNLKYPKMNATNDTEIVKQSMSSTISVFVGLGVFLISIFGLTHFYDTVDIHILITIHLIIITIISLVLYYILMQKGIKDYKNINV